VGIAPNDQNVAVSYRNTLGSKNYDLVQGSGYIAASQPSIFRTDDLLDVNQIALDFYDHPSAVKYLNGLKWTNANCSQMSPCTLGTDYSPQITYIKETIDKHIHLAGTVSGSGVLVLEGRTHLAGDFNFHGLVIVKQLNPQEGSRENAPFSITGSATIFGGLLTVSTNGTHVFRMEDTAKIYYSSRGLALAKSLCGSCLPGIVTPSSVRVIGWLDK